MYIIRIWHRGLIADSRIHPSICVNNIKQALAKRLLKRKLRKIRKKLSLRLKSDMSIIRAIGIGAIILALGMFYTYSLMFSHMSLRHNPTVSKMAEYSFVFWFPTLFFGISFFVLGKKRRKS